MSESDQSNKVERDQVFRSAFAKHLPEMLEGTPDLTLALLDVMFERSTCRKIIEGVSDFAAIEKEIAYSLFTIFLRDDASSPEDMELQYAILRALVDPEAAWQLKLNYGRRGRPKSAFADFERWERERSILKTLEALIGQGLKVESAINDVSTEFKISRSKAFEIWQRRGGETEGLKSLNESLARYNPRAGHLEPPNSAIRKGWMRRFFDYFTQEF